MLTATGRSSGKTFFWFPGWPAAGSKRPRLVNRNRSLRFSLSLFVHVLQAAVQLDFELEADFVAPLISK